MSSPGTRCIYLVRHGAVDSFKPRRFLGQTDVPLNGEGLSQATALGKHLQGIDFKLVFSSPLQRSLETAWIVSGRRPESIKTLPGLMEINLGAWEGLTVEQVQRKYPGEYERRGQDLANYCPPGGESFADLAHRAMGALAEVLLSSGSPILIVAHAGVNRVLLASILNHPLRDLFAIPQEYGCVNVLFISDESWQVEHLNQRLPPRV